MSAPTTQSEYDRILRAANQLVFNIEVQRNNDPLLLSSGTPTDIYIARMAYYDKLIKDTKERAQKQANDTESEYNRILRQAEQTVFNIEVQRNVDPNARLDVVGGSMMPDKARDLVIATNAMYDKRVSDVRAEAQRRANATLGK